MIVTFYIFASIAVLFSLIILLTKNVLYAAFSLVVVFFCLAGIYVMSGAPFVGVTQILVYIGGIIVFIVFGVMLTNKLNDKNVLSESHNCVLGYGIGVILFVGFTVLINQINFQVHGLESIVNSSNDVRQIGILLMSDYLIPFEISGVLLLLALIGATVIAGRKREEQL
jgi:NADH-quinone oxidoreductase subunit J